MNTFGSPPIQVHPEAGAPWPANPVPASHPRLGLVSPSLELGMALAGRMAQGLSIAASASSPDKAREVLQTCSHVVLDLTIVENTSQLTELLASCPSQVLVVTPDGLLPDILAQVQSVPGVARTTLIGVGKAGSRVNVRPFAPVRAGPPTAAPRADPVRAGAAARPGPSRSRGAAAAGPGPGPAERH